MVKKILTIIGSFVAGVAITGVGMKIYNNANPKLDDDFDDDFEDEIEDDEIAEDMDMDAFDEVVDEFFNTISEEDISDALNNTGTKNQQETTQEEIDHIASIKVIQKKIELEEQKNEEVVDNDEESGTTEEDSNIDISDSLEEYIKNMKFDFADSEEENEELKAILLENTKLRRKAEKEIARLIKLKEKRAHESDKNEDATM